MRCEAARQGSPDQFFLEAVVASASYDNFVRLMASQAAEAKGGGDDAKRGPADEKDSDDRGDAKADAK